MALCTPDVFIELVDTYWLSFLDAIIASGTWLESELRPFYKSWDP